MKKAIYVVWEGADGWWGIKKFNNAIIFEDAHDALNECAKRNNNTIDQIEVSRDSSTGRASV